MARLSCARPGNKRANYTLVVFMPPVVVATVFRSPIAVVLVGVALAAVAAAAAEGYRFEPRLEVNIGCYP